MGPEGEVKTQPWKSLVMVTGRKETQKQVAHGQCPFPGGHPSRKTVGALVSESRMSVRLRKGGQALENLFPPCNLMFESPWWVTEASYLVSG